MVLSDFANASGWSPVLGVRLCEMLCNQYSRDPEVFKNKSVVAFNCRPGGPSESNKTPHSIIFCERQFQKVLQNQELGSASPALCMVQASSVPHVVWRPLPESVHKTGTQSGFFQKLTSPTMRYSCRRAKSPGLYSNPW